MLALVTGVWRGHSWVELGPTCYASPSTLPQGECSGGGTHGQCLNPPPACSSTGQVTPAPRNL